MKVGFPVDGPIVALAAELIPGIVLPPAAAVPDLPVDGEAAAAAFGMKILVQLAARRGRA